MLGLLNKQIHSKIPFRRKVQLFNHPVVSLQKNAIKTRKLSRHPRHRDSLWKTMTTQLLQHERIKTTLPKAKELRRFADRMVTISKKGTMNARRHAARTLRDKKVIQKVFEVYPERYQHRNGGYTRIIPLGRRVGDGSKMAFIEMVDNHHPSLLDLKPPRKGNPRVFTPLYIEGTKQLKSEEEQKKWKEEKQTEISHLQEELQALEKTAFSRGLFLNEQKRQKLLYPQVKPYVPPPLSKSEMRAKGLLK